MGIHLSQARWGEEPERGPSQSARGSEVDYEIPKACISWVVDAGGGVGSSPVRLRQQQRPFGRRLVVVGKRLR